MRARWLAALQVGDVPGQLAADEPAPAESGSAESEAAPLTYEQQRELNIRGNQLVLASLGLGRDHVQPAPSKERVRSAKPALARRKQPTRKCTQDPSVAAAAAARADAVADVQRRPAAAAASEVDAAVRMRRQAAAAAASEDHAAGRMRPRPGPRPKDGTISTECRKDGCPWGAVRGRKGVVLGHGLCRNCAAEARAGANANAALQRSKRKAEDDAASEAAEEAVRRQPSDNAKGKARRVVLSDDDDDDDDDGAFEEVYPCKTPGCKYLAVLNFRTNTPRGHGLCRVHGNYKERVRCSLPSCNGRARVNGRCKLHKA
jgi:hypothetical protein